MTSEDRGLDPAVFGRKDLKLYRIAKAQYANLSGVGAALFPGRWNIAGQEAIYTSVEVSTPALELLAHTSKDTIPDNLALMHISFRGTWDRSLIGLRDQADDAKLYVFPTLKGARKTLPSSLGDGVIGVAVPSVIVPSWNVVLFPGSRGFWDHVSLLQVEDWKFDPRLFPATAQMGR